MDSTFLKMGLFLVFVIMLSLTTSCNGDKKKSSIIRSSASGISVKVKASKF